MLSAVAVILLGQCATCPSSQAMYSAPAAYMSNEAYYGMQGGGFHPLRAVGRAVFGGQARFNGGIQTLSYVPQQAYSYTYYPTRQAFYTTACPVGGNCAQGVCQTGACNQGYACPMGVCQPQTGTACYIDQYGRMICPAQRTVVPASPPVPSKVTPSSQSNSFDIVPSGNNSKPFETLKNFTKTDELQFTLTSFKLDDNIDFKLY